MSGTGWRARMAATESRFLRGEETGFPMNRPAATTDVIIMGGGILGLSTAHEVLSRGLSVTLLSDDPKKSATWASAGMISPYSEYSTASAQQDMLRAARVAYPAYVQRIEEHSRMKVELRFPGTLIPALDWRQKSSLVAMTQRFQDLGAKCRYLEPEEVASEEPQLGPRESGAVMLDDEGYVNPRSLHCALRSVFDNLGGKRIDLPALGLVARQGRVIGVETAAGVVMGGSVVNATGAWADRFLVPEDQARYRARPVRGQALRLRPPSGGLRHVIQVPNFGYLVPRADGTVIAGATSEEVGPFLGNTAGGISSVLERTERLVPSSAHWSFLTAVSGLRPMAGNGELFLEPDSARKGLFHGLGLYRHGILLAPVAATRLTRLVLEYLGHLG
jgi:glycine oxidase